MPNQNKNTHKDPILDAIRKIGHLIVRERDPLKLIQNACTLLVEERSVESAWIVLKKHTTETEPLAAQAGIDALSFKQFLDYVRRGERPVCFRQLDERHGVACIENTLVTCVGCPIAGNYRAPGALATELCFGEKNYGYLGVSVPERFLNDPVEAELLTGIAADLGLALDRLEHERALTESEERFRLAFEQSPLGMALVATDGSFRQTNRSLAVLLGFTREELAACNYFDLTHPEDRRQEMALFEDCLTGGREGYALEKRLLHENERSIWVRLNAGLLRNADGSPEHLVLQIQDVTERKQTREQLRRTALRLGLVAESSQIGIWDWNAENDHIQWDERMFRLYGLEPDPDGNCSYKTWHEGVHPEDRQAAEADLARAIEYMQDWHAEFRIVRPDGELRHIEAHARCFFAEPGHELHMIGSNLDITDRVRTRDALRESEEKFRAIAHWGFYWENWISPDRKLLWVSPAVERITGYTPAECYAMPDYPLPIIHPDDRERVQRDLENAARPEGSGESKLRLIRKDGRRIWFNVVWTPIFGENGRHLGHRSTIRDITDEHLTARALERREAELHEAQRIAQVGSWYLSLPDKTLELSDQARRILGIQVPGRVSFDQLSERVHPEDRPALTQRRRAALQGDAFVCLYRIRDRIPECWVEERADMEYDHTGRLSGIRATVQDISAFKRHETELERARAQAEEANLSKTRFLAKMSHELRTPLSGILGFSELLIHDAATKQFDPQTLEYLRHIEQSGQHLLALINDLLDLAKVEQNRVEVHWQTLDCRAELEGALAVLRSQARDKQLQLRLECEDADLQMRSDRRLLRQILLNLLSNAVKYSPQGGQVTLAARPLDGERLRIEVRDQGRGIPPEQRERIFDEFFQVDARSDAMLGGSGLGLSICHRFAQLLGGELGVEEAPGGQGSLFWCTLPRAIAEQDTQDHPPQATAAETPPTTRFQGKRILVAEDDAINRTLLLAMLEPLGIEPICAANGREALERLEHEPVDLVLMDMQMPEMDGLEASRELRSRDKTRALPLVALTASTDEDTRRQAREAGCDRYLSKPLDFEALKAVLNHYL